MTQNSVSTNLELLKLEYITSLGTGTFAQVIKARYNNQDVAVKIFSKMNFKDETKSEADFLKEATELKRTNHPNIIKLIAYGKWLRDDKLENCLVIEYAEVGSLHHVLYNKEINYTLGHAISWLMQCSDAINYLHSRTPTPTIHRDLKPLNLLLMKMGTLLKVCDFGSTANLKTTMTNDVGSPCWIAPEMLYKKDYNEKCDVYSYTVIAWEIMVRLHPYFHLKEINQFKLLLGVHSGMYRPKNIAKCPDIFKMIFEYGFNADPNKRPSMNMIFKIMKKLDSIINKTPIKPLELKNNNNNNSSLLNRNGSSNGHLTESKTEPAILVEKYYDLEPSVNNPIRKVEDYNEKDDFMRNQPGRISLSYRPSTKNIPFHRRSKSYGNGADLVSNLEQIKIELNHRIETMLYEPIEPLYDDNDSLDIFRMHRLLIKEDEKLQKDINALQQQYNQLELTKNNINFYNELVKRKNKLINENERLKQLL